MSAPPRLEFYRAQYEAELDHATKINSNVSTTLGVAVLLGGGAVVLFDAIPVGDFSLVSSLLLVLSAVAALALLLSFALLAGAWWGHAYLYVSPPEWFEDWWLKLEKYDQDYPPDAWDRNSIDTPPLADVQFNQELIRQYVHCATKNRETNAKKSARAHRAKTAILVAAFFLALAALPYYLLRHIGPSGGKTLQRQVVTNEREAEAATSTASADDPEDRGGPPGAGYPPDAGTAAEAPDAQEVSSKSR